PIVLRRLPRFRTRVGARRRSIQRAPCARLRGAEPRAGGRDNRGAHHAEPVARDRGGHRVVGVGSAAPRVPPAPSRRVRDRRQGAERDRALGVAGPRGGRAGADDTKTGADLAPARVGALAVVRLVAAAPDTALLRLLRHANGNASRTGGAFLTVAMHGEERVVGTGTLRRDGASGARRTAGLGARAAVQR